MYGRRRMSWLACSASSRKISRLVPPTSSVERAPKLFGCAIASIQAAWACVSRLEAALGERRAGAGRSGARPPVAYGAPTRRAYAAKPSSRTGCRSSRVRVEDVLAADLARRVEEREADSHGDLEERALLAVGLGEQPLVDRRELRRGRQPLRVVAQIGERALEPLDLERRDVDQTRGRAARSLERAEQVVDRRELGLPREDAGRLELRRRARRGRRACPVRHVRGAGEQPERREAEREDRAELDDVSAGLAHGELLRRLLVLVCDRSCSPLDAADELDGDAEEVLRGRLVEPRLPDEPREDELGGLVDRPAERGGDGAKDPLGDRDEVLG